MKFLSPLDTLRQFGLYGAQTVADLGAGAGHFSLCAADRLEGGTLYVVDVDADMLGRVVGDAQERGHRHVRGIRGDLSRVGGVPLADSALDRAIATNVLFQMHDRDAFAREVSRLLRSGGKVLVVDWNDTHAYGPQDTHKVSKKTAEALFGRHGFVKEKDIDAGEYHYGMIFMKP